MRTPALLLAVTLAAAPGRAEVPAPGAPPPRGLLTGLGLGLLVAGAAGTGLGVAGVVGAGDSAARLTAASGSTLGPDAAAVAALRLRLAAGQGLAVAGFTAGGVALAAGLLLLALDGPAARVALVPTAGGGALVFSGRF